MASGLHRFGLPDHVFEVVAKNISSVRQLRVEDGLARSDVRGQDSGISQGCPPSPSLFVLLLTVNSQDSVGSLSNEDMQKDRCGNLATLLYACDTSLAS